MRQVEPAEFGALNGVLQHFVLEFGHLAALDADLMVVRVAVVALLVLGRVTELVLDDQPCIDKQDDGVVESGPTDTELLLVGHEGIEGIYVKVTIYGVDGFEYSVSFGSLPMPVRVQVFCEYLPYRIFHTLILHCYVVMGFHGRQS